MHKKFFNWTRVFLLIGLLTGMLNAVPVQASGVQYAEPFTAPAKPVLVSPANGSLVQTITPALKWKHNGADHYEVQVAYDSAFLDLIWDQIITSELIISGFVWSFQLPQATRVYWRVKGFSASNEESPWSATWSLRTPLLPPVLVAPTAGESLFTDRPTFSWDPVPTATQYILQASTAANFGTLLINATVKSSTQYTITKDLPQNKTIYWRVRSKSATLTSAFSVKQSFITGNPPTVPVLLTPANGALVKDYTPLLDWKNSTTPTTPINTVFKRYEIQVDDNNDFSSPEIDTITTLDDITDSDFTPDTDLASNTKFYWRVRAVNTNDPNPDEHVSGWSTVWSFRTVISAPTTLTMVPTTNVLRPSFEWDDAIATPSGIIKSYNIQVSISPTFSTLIVNSTTVLSTYKMASNLPTGKTIYWRVRVNGTNGPSAWSNSQFVLP